MTSKRVLTGHVQKCQGIRHSSIRNGLHREPWRLSECNKSRTRRENSEAQKKYEAANGEVKQND